MIKSKLPADDLFEKSSMSFGEHLEALRRTLGKAFLWLGLGTIIGLIFANSVVKYIETPLKQAIRQFHINQAEKAFEEANGQLPPEELADWMQVEGLIPKRVFIDPEDLAASSRVTPLASVEDSEPVVDDEADAAEDDSVVLPTAESTGHDQLSPPLQNPWRGIDLAKLQRLKPLLIWSTIPNRLVTLGSTEGFVIWLKAGLVAGVIIGSPGIFWHIWQFLAAGLYPHERRYVYWYVPLSLLLFLSGVCLAFFVVFQLILGFLMTYTAALDVEFMPRLNDYMSMALLLPLGFGIAFQLPIVMLGLHRFGIVPVDAFIKHWRIAVVAMAFLSMMLTPAEIYSMLGLLIPLCGLYFFGIMLCKYMPQGAGVGAPGLDPKG